MLKNFSLSECRWHEQTDALRFVRQQVFINEQNVPDELEWDEFDDAATHILVLDGSFQPVATGRIKDDGHIGRMAVLKNRRQQGIGSEILLALLAIARQKKLESVFLHAQLTAVGFYKKFGFVCDGKEFLDAGIAHVTMVKKL